MEKRPQLRERPCGCGRTLVFEDETLLAVGVRGSCPEPECGRIRRRFLQWAGLEPVGSVD